MRALPRARLWVPLAILGVALAVRAAEPRLLASLELQVFDAYQRAAPRLYTDAPVRIVDLDDESLERLGQWPWPRTLVARLVDRLGELGAAVIVFDMVFAEPDRTSPQNAFEHWPESAELTSVRERLRELPDHDALLARAIARHRVVTGFSLTAKAGGRSPEPRAGISWGGPDPRRFLPRLAGSVANLPEIEAAAAGNGNFSLVSEIDGGYRRMPLLFAHGDGLYPSLAAEALRVAFGASTILVKSAGASGAMGFGETTGITRVRIGKLDVPTDAQGRVWLHYTRPERRRFVPAWRVISGEVDAASLRDHIVFIGTSAAGLADLRPTPLDPATPGVALHAQLAEQILLGHHLSRPDWALGAELLSMLALGAGLVIGQRRLGALASALLAAGAIASAVWLSIHAFTAWRWLLDPIYPSFVALSVYLSGSLLGFLDSEAERRRIRNAFAHYLSPTLVAELAAHPERLRLGGERRRLTLLFCDLRGFTALAERIKDPEQLTRLVNRFLTPMTDLIMERGGTIDKYMGDCIMAFWNAPLDDPHHARHACEAALAMLDRLEALNAALREEAEEEERAPEVLRIGIGLNTGDCCVGNLGADQRFDYSAIGDEVNLASRLEGQCKPYGVDVVIGENTLAEAPELATVELDRIRVQGKGEAVRIHALVGGRQTAESPEFQALRRAHDEMLRAYRAQDWDGAVALTKECRRAGFGLERLYALYRARIETYRDDPPSPDWDGVHQAHTK